MNELATEQSKLFLLLTDTPFLFVVNAILIVVVCITIILLRYPSILNRFMRRRREDKDAGKQVQNPDRQSLTVMIQNAIEEMTELNKQFKIDMNEVSNYYIGTTRKFVEYDEMIKNSTIQSCISNIYVDKIPIGYRFEAILTLFRLRINGNVKEKAVELILQEPNGRQHWHKAMSDDVKRNGECKDDSFVNSIRWIEVRVGI